MRTQQLPSSALPPPPCSFRQEIIKHTAAEAACRRRRRCRKREEDNTKVCPFMLVPAEIKQEATSSLTLWPRQFKWSGWKFRKLDDDNPEANRGFAFSLLTHTHEREHITIFAALGAVQE